MSSIDLLFCGAVWAVNQLRIHNDSPPLLEFGAVVQGTYLLLVLVVGFFGVLFCRRRACGGRPLSFALAVLLAALFLVRGGANLLDLPVAANLGRLLLQQNDVARLRATEKAIQSVSTAIHAYYQEKGGVPHRIQELSIEEGAARDGWGFRLVYSSDADGCGYELHAKGVPTRATRLPGFQLKESARMCETE